MNKLVVTLLASSVLALSTSVIAAPAPASASAPSNNGAGIYISGNVGYGNIDVNLPAIPDVTSTRDGVAWSAALGYQFNPYVAAEIGYLQFANIKFTTPLDTSASAKITTSAVDIAVKGIYPINDQFSVFGKVGVARLSHTLVVSDDGDTVRAGDTDHRITPLFAVGGSYNLTENWAVDLQGVTTLKSGDNFPATYSVLGGVTYKFS